jgi:hypothetical protein
MMKIRIRSLLLVAIALWVVWYFAGGREEIAWYELVHQTPVQGGWDLRNLDRYPRYGPLFYISAYGILILLVVSAIRGIGVVLRKRSKAKGQ